MKKKILSVILVISLLCGVFLLSSCEDNAAAVVEKAIEKTQNLDSYEAVMTINIGMEFMGASINMPMTYDIRVQNAKSDKPLMYAKMETTLLGETIDAEIYTDENWAYVSSDGEGMKFPVADCAEYGYDYTATVDDLLVALPDDVLENVTISTGSDGSTVLSVTLTDEQFAQMFKELVEDVNESDEMANIVGANASIEITAKGGYLTKYQISFNMKMDTMGVSADAVVTATIEYKNVGKPVTVTVPDSFKSFNEIDIGIDLS